MRTAVIIAGVMSHVEYANILKAKIIEPYQADVFLHVWDTESIPKHDPRLNATLNGRKLEYSALSDVLAAYHPKKFAVDSFTDQAIRNPIREVAPKEVYDLSGMRRMEIVNYENVFLQHYKLRKANELRKEYEREQGFKYDTIIRLRFDITVTQFPMITPAPNTIYIPQAQDHGGVCDQMAMGDVESMDKYLSLYDALFTFAKEPKPVVHPESALKKHLINCGLTVERIDVGLHLRGLRS